VTFIFELNLDSIAMNQHANYLGQRSFCLEVIERTYKRTHTRRIAL